MALTGRDLLYYSGCVLLFAILFSIVIPKSPFKFSSFELVLIPLGTYYLTDRVLAEFLRRLWAAGRYPGLRRFFR
jgi:hypothetical protein